MDINPGWIYPSLSKSMEHFIFNIEGGNITNSTTAIIGPSNTGKTTFIKLLAGIIEPDNGLDIPKIDISYKP